MIVERDDLVSLADRLGALQLVRLAIAAAVLGGAIFDSRHLGLTPRSVVPLSVAYGVLGVSVEALRRFSRQRGLRIVGWMLLIDGVYLATVLAPAGGPRNSLVFLVYVHVLAVTLLTSWRTGLKIAVWHSLLMAVGYWAGMTDVMQRFLGVEVVTRAVPHEMALAAAGFWMVAIGTAAFSNLSERELRRGKAELSALAAMGARFDSKATPQDVGAVLLDHVLQVFKFRRGAVATVEAHGGWAQRATWTERGPGRDGRAALEPVGYSVAVAEDDLVRRCWEAKGPVLARVLGDENPALSGLLPGAVNVVVIPLIADAGPVGVLVLERGGPPGTVISGMTVRGAVSFASHAALALRSAWLVAEIERLARFDSLTGLANRRVFEAALNREVARADRSGNPLSLVLIDVDHFKAVNDQLGHQAGDEVLRHVGKALAGEARETDLAARYGGEEFCVLLPGCPPEEAVIVAERLRAAIAARQKPTAVTASAGVATLPLDGGDGRALVAAADRALYQAKRSGRDRTCAATGKLRV